MSQFELLTTVLTRLILPHVKNPGPASFPQQTELRQFGVHEYPQSRNQS